MSTITATGLRVEDRAKILSFGDVVNLAIARAHKLQIGMEGTITQFSGGKFHLQLIIGNSRIILVMDPDWLEKA